MLSEKPSFLQVDGKHNFSGAAPVAGTPLVRRTPLVPLSEMPAHPGVSASKQSPVKNSDVFDKMISVALFALFFGVPIFFTGLTFQGVAFEKQIFFYFWLLVGVVAWVSKAVVTGEMRIRRTPVDIFLMLFLVVYALSAFASVDRWHSFWGFFGDPSRGLVSLLSFVLAYYFILSHFTMRRFLLMFAALLSSGFLVVVWSIFGLSGLGFLPAALEQYAPLSLIGTFSTLSVFISLLIPLFITGIYFVWNQANWKSSLRSIVLGVLGGGLVGSLYLMLALYPYLLDTKDALVWMVPLGGIAFFLVYILAQIIRPPQQLAWIPMLVFVAILSFFMIGNNALVRATLPIEVAPNQQLSFQVAKESLKEHFFLGVGPANYGYAFSQYRPDAYNQVDLYSLRFYQGTGIFFEALTTIGVVGTTLLLIIWLSFMSMGLYLLSSDKEKNKYLSLGLWTVSVMFFIAGFSASLNGTLLLLGTLLSSLALALLLKESGTPERYYSLSLKASPKYALALAFIFMLVSAGVAFLFVFVGKVYLADVAVGKASRLSIEGPTRESAALLGSAISKYPQEGRYYTRFGQEQLGLLLGVEVQRSAEDQDKDANSALYQQAMASLKEGAALMPNDVASVETLGLGSENGVPYVTGDDAAQLLSNALDAYSRASKLEPSNPLLLIKQAQMKRLLGDTKKDEAQQAALYKESEELLRQAIVKKPDLAAAHYNLSVTQSRLQNIEGALASVSTALKYDRTNTNFKYNLGILHQVRNQDGDKALAEQSFRDVLKTNEKLVDVRLSLGLLYESWDKKDQALTEYRKILDFLPSDGGAPVQSTKKQVEQLIENLQNGRSNIVRSGATDAVTPTLPEASSAVGPNASSLPLPTP